MMTKTKFHKLLFLFFSLALLAGCDQQAPIYVYVTPTPVPAIGALSTAVNTVTDEPTMTPSSTPAPTQVPTLGTLVPTVTFMGPVIGPNYTLPPSSTPEPTATPTIGPTATEPPPEAPQATATSANPAGTPLPTLDRNRMGMQLDWNLEEPAWQDAVGRRIDEDLDVQWLKVQVAWDYLQPNGPDEFGETFQRFELFMQYADREGFNILVSVAKAPDWARSSRELEGPPDDPQALANFMTFLLTKLPFIDAVEIWNEPNLDREWHGGLPFTGGGYMRLFGPSYQAIRTFSPGIKVVTAGLAPTGNNPGSRDDREYLREMYANGLGQYTDVAIGVHPYGWANPPDATCCGTQGWDDDPHFFFADTLRDYRQIMQSNGHGNNELWPTEFGWATWQDFPGDPPEAWMGWTDKWEQANYTMRAFEIGQQTPGIGPMFLWNLNYAVVANLVESVDERAAYSIVVPLQPGERPLYWMIHDAVRPDVQLPRYD